jgi:hypothetical protein
VSRFDKTNSATGIFRAPLNVALTATSGPGSVTDLNRILVVSLNSSGRLIKTTAITAAVGIIIATRAFAAGEMIDVMTHGEVVELDGADVQGGTALGAGVKAFGDVTAARLTGTAPGAGVNGFLVGWTVEATRLVVRCQGVQL